MFSTQLDLPVSLSLSRLRIADSTLFQPRISPVAKIAESQVEHFAVSLGLTFPGYQLVTSMASFLYPDATLERLTVIGKMMLVLFYIDDVFGDLPSSQGMPGYETPREVLISVDACCRAFVGSDEGHSDNLVEAFRKIGEQMREGSSPAWFDTITTSLINHLICSIYPARYGWLRNGTTTIEEYITIREYISGMYPTIDFVEFARGDYLPESLTNNPTILKLRQHVARIGCLTNDLFSYQKEVIEHDLLMNLLRVLQEAQKQSFTESVDAAIKLINAETDAFFYETATLWRETDSDMLPFVERYIEGLQYQISATWYWQISTERYRSPKSPFIELRTPAPVIASR